MMSSELPEPHSLTTKADAVGLVGVQHPQQPAVQHRGGHPGRLEQAGGPLVVGVDHVQGDVALQHPVMGTPEPAAPALGEQVDQSVAVGEDVTGPDGVRHAAFPLSLLEIPAQG